VLLLEDGDLRWKDGEAKERGGERGERRFSL
jgi:hypothetical protein